MELLDVNYPVNSIVNVIWFMGTKLLTIEGFRDTLRGYTKIAICQNEGLQNGAALGHVQALWGVL